MLPALTSRNLRPAAATVLAVLVAWPIVGALLPQGLPLGIVLLGLVLGSLTALTALGLVLIYRATRVVNFAQAEIGAFAATLATLGVARYDMPYVVAVIGALLVAAAIGAVIDATVIRRLASAPRLILMIATIGVAQVLGAAGIAVPEWAGQFKALTLFTTPFDMDVTIGPVVLVGDHFVAVGAAVLALVALAWFFGRTDTGIAVRGAADSADRALLLGIPVARLSRVTWIFAAALAGLGGILAAPILGPRVGVVAGPTVLLAPLAAAVLGRMQNLAVTVIAALAIGVFQQVVFWNWPRSSAVDVGLFLLVLVALLFQRGSLTRTDDLGLGRFLAVGQVREIPATLRRLPEIVMARRILAVAIGVGLLVVVPVVLSDTHLTLAAYMTIYGIIAASLVVLTGWAGQISLGQFAFVGVGASATAGLLVHQEADLFFALLVAAVAGAVVAVVIGLPALRVPGPFLPVITMAFAVVMSTYFLSSIYFPTLTPETLRRPILLERFDLETPRTFYYFCLGGLALVLVLTRNLRRSRVGRVVLAVRDNQRGAASFAVSPTNVKLMAFAYSGALAGFAGGLYVVGLRGISFAGFHPNLSVEVLTMVVVGGLGSVPGALLGAVYVQGAQYFLHGAMELLATGAGVLVLLLVLPGGLGEALYSLRDGFVRMVARRHRLSHELWAPPAPDIAPDDVAAVAPVATPSAALLSAHEVTASYGEVQVLFGVDLTVDSGEIVALLGTNGAGKSTVLRVVSGLQERAGGRIVFNGHDISAADPVERVGAGLVLVPGGKGVFPSLTVAENLRLAGWGQRHDLAFVEATNRRVLELFPVLAERLGQPAGLLSSGEQQMLALAQGLLCRPRLLMIDELSLGLAPAVVAHFLGVLQTLRDDGVGILLVEQSATLATEAAGRASFLERGVVRFAGPVDDLVGRTDLLRSVFLQKRRRRRRVRATEPRLPTAAEGNGAAAALELQGVRRAFGGIEAVRDVDLVVHRGSVLGLIGANGAGKTTLFDVCSGFLPATAGRVWLGGRNVTRLSASQRARAGLGRGFQDARLFPSLTVAEALAVALERHVDVREPLASVLRVTATVDSEGAVAERVAELLEAFGLAPYADHFVSELSTGMRRVVELACATAHGPDVLLLDEPSSGLAHAECDALADLLRSLRARTGTTMVVIEHDIPLVSSLADELACMHLGQVIARGKPNEVLENPDVVESYMGAPPVRG